VVRPLNKILCPDLPILSDYSKTPPESYWHAFPKCELPKKVTCDVSISRLEERISKYKHLLTESEISRARLCVEDLEKGASSFQKHSLPACFQQNSSDTIKYGREVSDAVASWVRKGFAAGPFDGPPVKGFRVNPLLAIQQNGKVRPVLNLSEPKGSSFNDNVDIEKLQKVTMSSSKQFAKSLYDAGKNAKFSKSDFVDAYKNVPVKIFDIRLQGFCWQNKYFAETRQVFGAKTAVQNFDIMANTLLSLTNCIVMIPKKYVHRTLDDIPVISPECRGWTEIFDKEFEDLCEEVNVKIAKPCEKYEKAFKSSTFGKVLGTFFDSEQMAWKSPSEKRQKCLRCIKEILEKETVTLKEMQTLMGNLNHAGQLAPFMAAFRHNLNRCLGSLQVAQEPEAKLSHFAREELRIWMNFVADDGWHPLPGHYVAPPLACLEFVSDAAGNQEGITNRGKLGCGNIGFNHIGEIIFASQTWWPEGVLAFHRDNRDKCLGAKTTTLEFLGILMPFLLIPEKMVRRHVIVKVDNTGCYFGWINRHATNDELASVLIRALHMISAFLECTVHIMHLPRNSNWEAKVVDRMSRESTTTSWDRNLLRSFPRYKLPSMLVSWMKRPREDWELPNYLLKFVMNKVKNEM
jgi:hypothetical protein